MKLKFKIKKLFKAIKHRKSQKPFEIYKPDPYTPTIKRSKTVVNFKSVDRIPKFKVSNKTVETNELELELPVTPPANTVAVQQETKIISFYRKLKSAQIVDVMVTVLLWSSFISLAL